MSSLGPGVMMRTLVAQSRMLDDYVQQMELVKREGLKGTGVGGEELARAVDDYRGKYDEMKHKLAEVTKEREALEAQISDVVVAESEMQFRFGQIVETLEEVVESSDNPGASEISGKLVYIPSKLTPTI